MNEAGLLPNNGFGRRIIEETKETKRRGWLLTSLRDRQRVDGVK